MADPDQLLLEKMTAMENRTQIWQADLDQELQRLNSELSQHLQVLNSTPSPSSMDQLALQKEMQQMRQFLVETLKLLKTMPPEGTTGTSPVTTQTTLKRSGNEAFLEMKDATAGSTGSSVSAAMVAKEKELKQREELLQVKEKDLMEREQRWQREMKEMSLSPRTSEAVLEKERELLDFKDRQLAEREQALQREKQLQQDREHSFHAREKLLLDREVAMQAEKKLHQEREQFLQSKERQQQEREDSLQAQKKLQQEREESLETLERLRDPTPMQVSPATPAKPAAPRRSKTTPSKVAAGPPAPAAAASIAPKRVAARRSNAPVLEAKERSSRSRERGVEVQDPAHHKTKKRKVSTYLTFEELRWEWIQRQPIKQPQHLMVLSPKKQPLEDPGPRPVAVPEKPAKPEKPPCSAELPWDTDLMVELDEVEHIGSSPSYVQPDEVMVVPSAGDEAYAVDDLDEEDLFGPDEALYEPPKASRIAQPPLDAPKPKPPEIRDADAADATASGAAKNKKKDWYQRHYPGQVAPREPRSAANSAAIPNSVRRPKSHVASKPGPRVKGPSSDVAWAYEPLKSHEPPSQGLLLPDPLMSELPSIDDILPML